MRTLAILAFAVALTAVPARASACPAGREWRVDHYVYDASLHKDWEVLVNCDHPAAPARMRFVPDVVGKDIFGKDRDGKDRVGKDRVGKDMDEKDVDRSKVGKDIAAPLGGNTAAGVHAVDDAPGKRNAKSFQSLPVRITAGTAVEVLNAPDAPVSILLSGTAIQTAFPGQTIHVRLSATGRFVEGVVRGPHSVELVAAGKPVWGQP